MSHQLQISVIVPTHNPRRDYLERVLVALRGQTLPSELWETILVDNASTSSPPAANFRENILPNLRVVAEPRLGLAHARRAGLRAARANLCVLVDDDNVLGPGYLSRSVEAMRQFPTVGAAGGRSEPDFEVKPPEFTAEFFGLLALRDLGDRQIFSGPEKEASGLLRYPTHAPIGAGMVLRRAAWECWLNDARDSASMISDRRGDSLTSGGDNDIVLCVLRAGWEIAYLPELNLTHLIPPGRTEAQYLARLNRSMQNSWMRVLTFHQANPFPSLGILGAWLRQIRSWWTYQAFRSPAHYIRWNGARGHYAGRVRRGKR